MEIRVGFMKMTAMNKFFYLFGAVTSIFSSLLWVEYSGWEEAVVAVIMFPFFMALSFLKIIHHEVIFSCLMITGLIGALLLIRFKFKKERLLLMFISGFLMNLKTLESLVIALSV